MQVGGAYKLSCNEVARCRPARTGRNLAAPGAPITEGDYNARPSILYVVKGVRYE